LPGAGSLWLGECLWPSAHAGLVWRLPDGGRVERTSWAVRVDQDAGHLDLAPVAITRCVG
jgi:hypothetical protein